MFGSTDARQCKLVMMNDGGRGSGRPASITLQALLNSFAQKDASYWVEVIRFPPEIPIMVSSAAVRALNIWASFVLTVEHAAQQRPWITASDVNKQKNCGVGARLHRLDFDHMCIEYQRSEHIGGATLGASKARATSADRVGNASAKVYEMTLRCQRNRQLCKQNDARFFAK